MKTLRLLTTAFSISLAAGLFAPAAIRAQDNTMPDAPVPPDATIVQDDTAPAATDDSGTPSFDYFADALQDYGQWVQVDGYGACWQPNVATTDPNWQPYTDGYWAYTDAGWTWVSYEDFGWITYHYGRWTRVEDAGWVWVPDYEWAPAWVSWRQSRASDAPDADTYIGWAPLPPEVHFRRRMGISFWVDSTYDIGPGVYSFCRVRDFGAPVLGPVIIDRSRNVTIINSTTNITNITTNNNIVYVGGPNYRTLSRRVDPAHPIQALQLVRQTDAGNFRHGGKGALAQAKGNQLIVAAPLIVAPTQPFKPAKVAKVFDKPKIDKGWSGVTDPKQKLQIQAAIKAQNKGLKPEQPARPVTAQQLAVIPKGPTPVPPAGTTPGKRLKPAIVPGQPTPAPAPGVPVQTPPGRKPRPTPPVTSVPAVVPGQPTPLPAPGVPLQTPPGRKPRPTPPVTSVPAVVPGQSTPPVVRKPLLTPPPRKPLVTPPTAIVTPPPKPPVVPARPPVAPLHPAITPPPAPPRPPVAPLHPAITPPPAPPRPPVAPPRPAITPPPAPPRPPVAPPRPPVAPPVAPPHPPVAPPHPPVQPPVVPVVPGKPTPTPTPLR